MGRTLCGNHAGAGDKAPKRQYPRSGRLDSIRISKKEWYARGGLANSALWRRQEKRGAWQYYMLRRDSV